MPHKHWSNSRFGDDMRQAAGLPLAGLQVSEWAYLTFVASSVPCWGLYVLALDNSNRRARAQSKESLQLLEDAHARQIAVAELGLLGSSDCTLHELNEACLHLLRKHIPEASVTVDADGLQPLFLPSPGQEFPASTSTNSRSPNATRKGTGRASQTGSQAATGSPP